MKQYLQWVGERLFELVEQSCSFDGIDYCRRETTGLSDREISTMNRLEIGNEKWRLFIDTQTMKIKLLARKK